MVPLPWHTIQLINFRENEPESVWYRQSIHFAKTFSILLSTLMSFSLLFLGLIFVFFGTFSVLNSLCQTVYTFLYHLYCQSSYIVGVCSSPSCTLLALFPFIFLIVHFSILLSSLRSCSLPFLFQEIRTLLVIMEIWLTRCFEIKHHLICKCNHKVSINIWQ